MQPVSGRVGKGEEEAGKKKRMGENVGKDFRKKGKRKRKRRRREASAAGN